MPCLRPRARGADFDIAIEFFQRVRDLVDQRDVEEIQRRLSDFDQADVMVLSRRRYRCICSWGSSLN